MTGRIYRLEELTSPALSDFDRQRTAFLIAISPLEGHGPHLPLGVDFFNARYFVETLADIIHSKKPEFDIVILPAIPLGAQVYRDPGSLRITPRTLYDIAIGLGDSLASWGFKYIFLLSGHGSPRHIVALESACLRISRKYQAQMHNLSGALAIRFLRGEFVDRISEMLTQPLSADQKELLKNDIHGGWWETSMMLHLYPHLVGEYKSLETIKRGDNTNKRGYYGSPALASKEFAEASLKVITNEASAIIGRVIDGTNSRSDTVSILRRIPMLRPYSVTKLSIASLVIIILILLAIIIIR